MSDPVLTRLLALLEEGARGEAADLAADLVMRVTAIADRSMTPEVLRAFASECDDAGLLAALQHIFVQARQGNRGARFVTQELALNAELFLTLEGGRSSELWMAAHRAELHQLKGLFSKGRPGRHNPSVDESGLENDALPIPLGLRKQAARGRDRQLLDRLMRDGNPQVIEILLTNPFIRERDVVFIAAKRPTRPENLRTVAKSRRWSSCYAVRKALSCNPHTPQSISLKLLATLMAQDLRFIMELHVVPEAVRLEAGRLYGLK